MLISWNKKSSLSYGIEDTFLNIIDNKIVTACGYNGGIKFSFNKSNSDSKKNKYHRSLKNYCYHFDFNENKWIKIEDFPGIPVQCGRTVEINNKIYMYGGYNFIPCPVHLVHNKSKKENYKTIKNGYLLEFNKNENEWSWNQLPDLPESLTNFGMTSYKNYIYICCGAYNDDSLFQPLVDKNEINNNLWRLDTDNLEKGWEYIAEFPGTKRINFIFTQINGVIYMVGGIYPRSDWRATQKHRFYNIKDNWKYHIDENKWEKIDLDICNHISNWGYSNDKCVYKNRYIFMLAGYSYEYIVDENKKLIKNNSFRGVGHFTNHIHIYDTVDNKVITSKSKLFCRTTSPDFIIKDDKIYIVGGESIPYRYQKEPFGRHSDVFMEGTITGL